MNKIKVLTYLVVALFVVNLSMIVFFILHKPENFIMRKAEPKKIIIEKLHFDKQQQEQYFKLIEKHKNKISNLEQDIFQTKGVLYGQLSQTNPNLMVKDSLLTRLSDLQKQVEITHFEHFKEIKKLCINKGQQEDFKELTAELSSLFSAKRKSNR